MINGHENANANPEMQNEKMEWEGSIHLEVPTNEYSKHY
jgi:hypothetical protein